MDKPLFDFGGWATRSNVKCSDGRTILKDAFKECNGKTVPLVWGHKHDQPEAVLGHVRLENRDEGIYAYGLFNASESGQNAKMLVEHGDVSSLSIYANELKQQGANVVHGAIREVSLVLAGANPEAFINNVIRHGEDADLEEAVIYTGEYITLAHSQDNAEPVDKENELKHADSKGEPKKETVADVIDTFSEKQKLVMYALVDEAIKQTKEEYSKKEEPAQKEEGTKKEEETPVKHNVFDQSPDKDAEKKNSLSHSDMMTIIDEAKRYGSLRDSVLAHGITDVDYLFPEAKTLTTVPEFVSRQMGWVRNVMGGVHHTPFSRIKSVFADITADEARAKGYAKGNFKIEEVFGLLKRTTTPTTVYKKQKMDRDDVTDITDFDVVAMLKSEMRIMLDEEIARAILTGDGRTAASDSKIDEQNIRPIWTDSALFSLNKAISVAANATSDEQAKACIRGVIEAFEDYEGSGDATYYVTPGMLTKMLLLEDKNGRIIYDTVEKLRTALQVKEIVSVPIMKGLTRVVEGVTRSLVGIIVNLNDYNIGADKGGSVSLFDGFDLDYNQQKYLIETRCSGALTKPHSAIIVETVVG